MTSRNAIQDGEDENVRMVGQVDKLVVTKLEIPCPVGTIFLIYLSGISYYLSNIYL